jgi:tRNA nucleotidyltransferase (CCA-adding enzyme)
MQIPIPPEVKHILTALQSAGFEAFIVGGCVRDILRGITPKDWDIATAAIPEDIKRIFPRTFDTGIKHGTITVLQNRLPFEVTTYRIDGPYHDARRPQSVTFATRIEEDLSRRDFTMNAIAYNPQQGFVDPFDGLGDIQNKTIRCVGDPVHRFGEDALRMLRAIRFAATLGFAVDPGVLSGIQTLYKNLAKISGERIREELTRLLCGAYPSAIFLLEATGLMPYVLQGRDYEGDLKKTVRRIEQSPKNEHIRLSLFFSSFNTVGTLLRNLRFDNKTIKAVGFYTRFLTTPIPDDRYEIKKLLRQLPKEASFDHLLTLREITNPTESAHVIRNTYREIHENNECYTLQNLAINGRDLAEVGFPSGKIMGDILETLLDTVMRNPSLNKKRLLTESAKSLLNL